MGYSVRYFMAEDEGTLTRVPAARCHRWFAGEEVVPVGRASRELKLLEVVVEVERRRVVDVRRILPVRHHVDERGGLDISAAMRLAQTRLDIRWRLEAGDASARIDQLEADANAFWWPTDQQIEAVGTALFEASGSGPFPNLRGMVWRPCDASDAA